MSCLPRNLSLLDLESLQEVDLHYLEVNDQSNSPLFLTQIISHWIYVFSLLIRSNYIFVEDEALKIIKIISFRSKTLNEKIIAPKVPFASRNPFRWRTWSFPATQPNIITSGNSITQYPVTSLLKLD